MIHFQDGTRPGVTDRQAQWGFLSPTYGFLLWLGLFYSMTLVLKVHKNTRKSVPGDEGGSCGVLLVWP